MQALVRIYDTNMNRVAHLENVFDLGYELPLNELWTASFSLPKDDPKARACAAILLCGNIRRHAACGSIPHDAARDYQERSGCASSRL